METPSVVFYEHNFDDTIIQSLSKNVLNLGNECRALAEENKRLKEENERLSEFCTRTIIPNEQLQAEIEMLKGRVNYWKIEAECDHGRWLRCLEDLEHLRNLK
jgi:hypothetical protein